MRTRRGQATANTGSELRQIVPTACTVYHFVLVGFALPEPVGVTRCEQTGAECSLLVVLAGDAVDCIGPQKRNRPVRDRHFEMAATSDSGPA